MQSRKIWQLAPKATPYCALRVNTLTLTPGALKLKVFPVVMVLVTGTIKFGVVGVLLAVAEPVSTCAVPVVETVLNGMLKVKAALALAVLEI